MKPIAATRRLPAHVGLCFATLLSTVSLNSGAVAQSAETRNAATQRAETQSCDGSIEGALDNATGIVEAEVRSVNSANGTLELSVTQVFRGTIGTQLVVSVRDSGAAASLGSGQLNPTSIETGRYVILYLSGSPGGWFVDGCSRAVDADNADLDRQRLGSGVVPYEVSETEHARARTGARARNPATVNPGPRGCGSCMLFRAQGPGPSVFLLMAMLGFGYVSRSFAGRRSR